MKLCTLLLTLETLPLEAETLCHSASVQTSAAVSQFWFAQRCAKLAMPATLQYDVCLCVFAVLRQVSGAGSLSGMGRAKALRIAVHCVSWCKCVESAEAQVISLFLVLQAVMPCSLPLLKIALGVFLDALVSKRNS